MFILAAKSIEIFSMKKIKNIFMSMSTVWVIPMCRMAANLVFNQPHASTGYLCIMTPSKDIFAYFQVLQAIAYGCKSWSKFISSIKLLDAIYTRFPIRNFFLCVNFVQDQVTLQFSAHDLDKKKTFGTSDPFLYIRRVNGDKSWVVLWISGYKFSEHWAVTNRE